MKMSCFADDPVAFFVENSLYVHHMPLDQQEALQLEALQLRFAAMRDAIAPLTALANASGISEIGRIEDVVPMMFPHTLFKRYPHHFLDNLRFPELTEWLSRLTLVDLSPVMPGRASTDWQSYMGRMMAAQKQGRMPPELTPYVAAKQKEVALVHADAAERLRTVLGVVRDELGGSPVHMAGGLMLLHRVAQEGLQMGMEPGLGPRSRVSTGGGTKGLPSPPDMEATIKRFAGVDVIYEAYGMTEIGDAFGSCDHGRFHIWPWIVPFVLDEKTGAPFPRRGKQRGRAAFFDLSAQTCWGGVVTGDRVSISWDRCPCGRSTPQVLPPIERIPPSEQEEHAPSGAGPLAVHAAVEALNRGF